MILNQPVEKSATTVEMQQNTSHVVRIEPDSTKASSQSKMPQHSALNDAAITNGSLFTSPQASSTTTLINKVDQVDDTTHETPINEKLPVSSSSTFDDSSGSSTSVAEASQAVIVTIGGGHQA